MNLLIVDDSREMRRAIKSFVCDLADELHECADGSESLAAYALHHPDWVLMDIKMKDTDGINATKQLKAAFPEAQIVIVTNYDDAELREAARAAGACGYVVKENLLELRRVLGAPTH